MGPISLSARGLGGGGARRVLGRTSARIRQVAAVAGATFPLPDRIPAERTKARAGGRIQRNSSLSPGRRGRTLPKRRKETKKTAPVPPASASFLGVPIIFPNSLLF